MSQVQLIRVAIKPGKTDRLVSFLRGLQNRGDEVRASLEAEGIISESLFVDQRPEGDLLYFYTRATDLAKASAAFQASQLPLDVETKQLISETWGRVEALELVVDLERG